MKTQVNEIEKMNMKKNNGWNNEWKRGVMAAENEMKLMKWRNEKWRNNGIS